MSHSNIERPSVTTQTEMAIKTFEEAWAAFAGKDNLPKEKAIASFFYHLGRYDGVKEAIR